MDFLEAATGSEQPLIDHLFDDRCFESQAMMAAAVVKYCAAGSPYLWAYFRKMSVYTELSSENVNSLLSEFNLGDYRSHQGISAGVENTNYFVETSTYSLVLTVFEKHTHDELPFYLQLGEHLHADKCKVPQPFRSKSGDFVVTIKEKPAVFVERLQGNHVEPTESFANEIAAALADIHCSTASFKLKKTHSHNRQWVRTTAKEISPSLNADDQAVLSKSLTLLMNLPVTLPTGIIHADLFHDNALFKNDHISGVIDWYFAGEDSYALDLAITMNDWCLDDKGHFDLIRGETFIETYHLHRPLSELEMAAIPILQVQAATRFWLSRLIAQRQHLQSNDKITVKDPEQMKQLLTQLLSYT